MIERVKNKEGGGKGVLKLNTGQEIKDLLVGQLKGFLFERQSNTDEFSYKAYHLSLYKQEGKIKLVLEDIEGNKIYEKIIAIENLGGGGEWIANVGFVEAIRANGYHSTAAILRLTYQKYEGEDEIPVEYDKYLVIVGDIREKNKVEIHIIGEEMRGFAIYTIAPKIYFIENLGQSYLVDIRDFVEEGDKTKIKIKKLDKAVKIKEGVLYFYPYKEIDNIGDLKKITYKDGQLKEVMIERGVLKDSIKYFILSDSHTLGVEYKKIIRGLSEFSKDLNEKFYKIFAR